MNAAATLQSARAEIEQRRKCAAFYAHEALRRLIVKDPTEAVRLGMVAFGVDRSDGAALFDAVRGTWPQVAIPRLRKFWVPNQQEVTS